MKKPTYLLTIFAMSVILLNAVSMLSMEINYKQQALQAEEYNRNNPKLINLIEGLLILPNGVLNQIFCFDPIDNQIKSLENKPYLCINSTYIYWNLLHNQAKLLEDRIKFFMQLRTVCKHFSHKLTFETIGRLCKDYDQNTKDQTLKCLAHRFFSIKARLPALILICAGANDHTTSWGKDTPQSHAFFYSAVLQNDTSFIATLLKHGASPDVKINNDPLFFSAKTIEATQLFIDYGVNIHANGTSYDGINVLWTTLSDEYPSEIMALYIKNDADVTLCRWNKFCLLHAISAKVPFIKKNGNNLLKKATFLLNAIPSMINTIDGNGRTPLNIAQEALDTKFSNGKRDKVTGEYIEYTIPEVTKTAEKLCALFQEHGALSAKELEQ